MVYALQHTVDCRHSLALQRGHQILRLGRLDETTLLEHRLAVAERQIDEGAAEQCRAQRGHTVGGDMQILVESECHADLARIGIVKRDLAHLADFKTVDDDRRGALQPGHILIFSDIIVGGREEILPFEIVDAEYQDYYSHDDRYSYAEFLGEYLFHFGLLILREIRANASF